MRGCLNTWDCWEMRVLSSATSLIRLSSLSTWERMDDMQSSTLGQDEEKKKWMSLKVMSKSWF
jgi:hypothetical protein